MLQPTRTTLFKDTRLRPDAIAFCPETGANLTRSRRHSWYVLFVPCGELVVYRRWHRRKVLTDKDALARAQWALNKASIDM